MITSLSNNRQATNWEFLWRKLEAGAFHQTVSARFARVNDNELSVVLRHHTPDGVSDPDEIAFRAAVDEWLGQVEMLYVAWLCGYVPDPAKQDQAATLHALLKRDPLRSYYERYYPIALPWLFRLHLEGSVRIEPTTQDEAAGGFERFATLYERFRDDENLGEFLNFLDDFHYGPKGARIDIGTVVAAFESPTRVIDALQRPAQSVSVLDQGIIGLVRFLTFSQDLDGLLRLCAQMPLVQSIFWFFYGYWFTEFKRDVATESTNAIGKIVAATVEPHTTMDPNRRAMAAKHGDELKRILQRLTGGGYAKPLYTEVRRAVATHPGKSSASARKWLKRFSGYMNRGEQQKSEPVSRRSAAKPRNRR